MRTCQTHSANSSGDWHSDMSHLKYPAFTAIVLSVTLLAGCAAPNPDAPSPTPAAQVAEPALPASATVQERVNHYLNLAQQSAGNERARYQLRAAEALISARRLPEAGALLAAVQAQDEALLASRQVLLARVALAGRQSDTALSALAPLRLESIDPDTARNALQIRAEAHAQLNQRSQEIRDRIALDARLSSSDARHANRLALWEALSRLDQAALHTLQQGDSPDLRGWVDLTLAFADDQSSGVALENRLEEWRAQHPDHAAVELLPMLLEAGSLLSVPATRIAVLLPEQGQFARAAEAVRAGMLAAWFEDARPERPALAFYDASATTARAAYERAVADGSQLIVGPLEKGAVQAIGTLNLTAPALLLNTLDGRTDTAGVALITRSRRFAFSLSPEGEAAQVADRAWFDGHTRALVLRPEDDWGARVGLAFRARWNELGGEVVEERSFAPGERDIGSFVRSALQIRGGPPGKKDEQTGKEDMPARWRQDVDMIFMAAFPTEARQIAPQLRFFDVSDLPLYATSHAYQGPGNREADSDLEGVLLGDMPWLVDPAHRNATLFDELRRSFPDAPASFLRLHAFGVDAYALTQRLRELRMHRGARLSGQTGELEIGDDGTVVRRLTWCRFANGALRIIEPDDDAALRSIAQ